MYGRKKLSKKYRAMMTTRTYGNCAEHFAVDKEVHAFSVTLHLNVLDWIHWTIPAHKHNQNSTATNRKY